jgi:hypothetical protein
LTDLYPNYPGHRDVSTSVEAAAETAPRLKPAHVEILALLARHPLGLTADEIAEKMGWTVLFARPRVSELRAKNRIAATGERRRNASKMNAKVWRVA